MRDAQRIAIGRERAGRLPVPPVVETGVETETEMGDETATLP